MIPHKFVVVNKAGNEKGARCPWFNANCVFPDCECRWPTKWEQAKPWLLGIGGILLIWLMVVLLEQ